MKVKINPFDYWERLIMKNRTMRNRIFIDNKITNKSVYFHTIIFNEVIGIESSWGVAPNKKLLLEYIKYSFLPEAFYRWIYKNDNNAMVPIKTAYDIINEAKLKNKISNKDFNDMNKQIQDLIKISTSSSDKFISELKMFCRTFNKRWFGDSEEFLYLKIFENAKEMGNFVLDSNNITDYESKFESKIALTDKEWLNLCENITTNEENEVKFKNIIFNSLNDVI